MNSQHPNKQTCLYRLPHRQQGTAVLAMTMVILAVLTIIGITSSKSTVIETRMSTNYIEKHKSQIAAESGLSYALNEVNNFDEIDFLETCNRSGIYDLRSTASATCPNPVAGEEPIPANNLTAWNGIASAANWNWNSTSLRGTMLDTLSATDSPILLAAERNNPMRLVNAPQFAIGIHDPVLRAGSEGQYCFPVSIIAAAKGGVDQTQTLIEVKTLSGCFYPP